jgi:translation initiation factor 2 alpha subunit (eIF-2alpha)
VSVLGRNDVFVVCEVNTEAKVVDLRLLKGTNSPVEKCIQWSMLLCRP